MPRAAWFVAAALATAGVSPHLAVASNSSAEENGTTTAAPTSPPPAWSRLPSEPVGLLIQDEADARGVRITNGFTAPGGYKYHTQIKTRFEGKTYSCGASVVGARHLLTAAHCVAVPGAAETSAWIGYLTRAQMTPGRAIKVKRTFIHPNYNDRTFVFDAAILELERDVDEDFALARFAIASDTYHEAVAAEEAYVCGMGFVNESGERAEELQCAQMPIATPDECQAATYRPLEIDRFVCSVPDGLTSVCAGDSGTALFLEQNVTNRNVILGLSSHLLVLQLSKEEAEEEFGVEFAVCPAGTVVVSKYARVSGLKKWINNLVKDLLVVDECGFVVLGRSTGDDGAAAKRGACENVAGGNSEAESVSEEFSSKVEDKIPLDSGDLDGMLPDGATPRSGAGFLAAAVLLVVRGT